MESEPSFLSDPSVVFMTALIADVKKGVIQLPRFQRAMTWTREQRLDLLDSIRRGIPIGGILLWRTNLKLATHRHLGPQPVPEEPVTLPHQYVIDGGQRLATLLSALYPLPKAPAEGARGVDAPDEGGGHRVERRGEPPDALGESPQSFNVHFDLDEERFVTPESEQPPEHWLPLASTLETIDLLKFQRKLRGPRANEFVERSDALATRLRAYKVPIIALASDNLELATATFHRVNSTGTKMSEPDMVSALSWSPEFDLHARLDRVREESLGACGWGDVDDDTLLRCVKAFLDLDLYESPEKVSARIREKPDAVAETGVVVVRVAEFLRDACGIPIPDLIPYSHQIPLLTYALSRALTPSPSVTEKLQAWLWLTTFAELFAGISGFKLNDVRMRLATLVTEDRFEWPGRPFARRPLPARFDFRHARARALALQLARRNPDGTAILARDRRLALMKLVGKVGKGDRAESPGNRFLAAPSERNSIAALLRAGDPHACNVHLVGQKALRALQQGHDDQFVDARLADLSEMEEEFVAKWKQLLEPAPEAAASPQQPLPF